MTPYPSRLALSAAVVGRPIAAHRSRASASAGSAARACGSGVVRPVPLHAAHDSRRAKRRSHQRSAGQSSGPGQHSGHASARWIA